jgi:hypothetical protein
MNELESSFARWIEDMLLTSPPPSAITAFNIGLFESPNGYTAYVIGSEEYDPKNDDWACQEGYSPKQRYLELPPEFIVGKVWQEIEGEMVGLVKNFLCMSKDSDNILSTATVVTVGFDDGVLIRVK